MGRCAECFEVFLGGITKESNKELGRKGLISAISYFGMNGYTINLPLNDTQWYDMIIEKDCHFYTVQCKFTDSKDNKISFRSCGGTNGGVYDNILEHPLDLLFCANNEHSYVIPMKDIRESGNVNSITLKTEPNKNNQGFNTYKYLVK